ncbi:proline oxidase, putative [Talaromyces stipitatus ATCC 10500]|uniref:Proline dehydrogenase n=1 Tax=Talaromyces stipitatus (strain ATCC 10500 / CBS 375.48 / QM 6759 / NRRL 1006) TaxID=441959 RepID=B8MEE7_TALSN|nr:proline oxidase, putative [Talaromyces stipitatus ATCC 10500]EED16574.1 proline oxidase, putative [Talaromyces stipitatus ATCC 10500]
MYFSRSPLALSRSLRNRVVTQIWYTHIATYSTSSPRHHDHVGSTRPTPTDTTAIDIKESTKIINEGAKESYNKTDSTSALSILPLSAVIRTLAITTLTSVPFLLGPALAALSVLANSKSRILDPNKNVIVNAILRKTIYSQFCAGETPTEVRKTIADLKRLGFAGVILGYGREVVMDGTETSMFEHQSGKDVAEQETSQSEQNLREIQEWKQGTMQTVDLADAGDFVALKFTGAGREALRHLVQGLPPSPNLQEAINEICDRAKDRQILLLFDAEQHAVQNTIDSWVLDLQRRYNKFFTIQGKPRALIYNTYQAYRQSTPKTLASHLSIAQRESFVMGVKLVRGAYLNSDPRRLFWTTKQQTDDAYDAIAKCLMTRKYNDLVEPDRGSSSCAFPQADLVLASHNRASVDKARALRDEQSRRGEPSIQMVYGQLQGMADDISCPLVRQSMITASRGRTGETPKPYKYLVWGTVGECTKYLLRRGHENRDAASRTKDTRTAMWKELKRRAWMGGISSLREATHSDLVNIHMSSTSFIPHLIMAYLKLLRFRPCK